MRTGISRRGGPRRTGVVMAAGVATLCLAAMLIADQPHGRPGVSAASAAARSPAPSASTPTASTPATPGPMTPTPTTPTPTTAANTPTAATNPAARLARTGDQRAVGASLLFDAAPASPGPADELIDGQPGPEELTRARADVARLPDAALAGQVLVIGYDGRGTGNAAALMRATGAAGVIVLGGNVPVPVADRVPAMQALSAAARTELARTGRDWPAAVGIDQEGGVVTRIAAPLTPFPAPMAVGAAGDPNLARAVAEASGRELLAAGFTVVLGPTGDVTDGRDAAIGIRSLAGEPELAGRMAAAMARGYADAGIVSTAKHFPGHGRVRTDSHVDRPVLAGSLDTLLGRDLAPFARLARDRAPGIMVGHLLVPAVDAAKTATLSRPVLTGLLRERLGFDGLVVTDSMEMGAISAYVGSGPAAVAALAAGADVVLQPVDPVAARDGIVAALRSGALPRTRVEDAAARLVATLRQAAVRAGATPGAIGADVPVSAAIGANAGVAQELARGSLVQLGGVCGARLVGPMIVIEGGEAADRAALGSAARRAGLRVALASGGTGTRPTRVALVGGTGMWAGASYPASSAMARSTYGDVVVGLDNPLYLGMAHADVAKIATFGRTPATWDALVAVLLGQSRATAKLPLAIEGAPVGSGC